MSSKNRIALYSDFLVSFTDIVGESGDTLDFSDVDQFQLVISESDPSSSPVVDVNSNDHPDRFNPNNSVKSVGVQVYYSDYNFVVGRDYYFQLWITEGSLRYAVRLDKFYVEDSINPLSSGFS